MFVRRNRTEIPQGVYTLEDLKTLGEEREWCPYFMTRHLLNHATIVVYNYQYMLDPKVRVSRMIRFLNIDYCCILIDILAVT